jgi:ribosomal-protein-alanine N-acetyltransferase
MSDVFEKPIGVIQTSRLKLRPLTLEDSAAVFGYASNPEVARYTLWRPHPSELFTKGFIKVLTQPQTMNWAITVPPSGEAIGMVFLHSYNKQHQKAEMAFNLGQENWGKGIATEAAKAVLDYAFKELGLHRIEATCMPANLASIKVVEKIGFAHEGRMIKSHSRYDGFHDMDLFAILSAR